MRITIGIKVLAIVLLLGSAQTALHVYFVVDSISSELYQESKAKLFTLSTRYQLTLEYLLQNQQQGQIQKEISAMGADKRFKVAALLDNEDTVQASIHFADIGTQVVKLVSNTELPALRNSFID